MSTPAAPRCRPRRRHSRQISMGDRSQSVLRQRASAVILDDPIRMLEWDDRSHFKVLTQLYGSVWPRVLPFCLVNTLLTIVIYYAKQFGVDLTCAPSAHKYMAIMMSFLIVRRVQICYDIYMSSSRNLSALYRCSRELVQYMCIITAIDESDRAKQWRFDVAYATLILLRATMSVLEFPAHPEQEPWHCPELPPDLAIELHEILFVSRLHSDDSLDVQENDKRRRSSLEAGAPGEPHCLVQVPLHERNDLEEACRIPLLLSYKLREEIIKQRDGTWLKPDTLRHPCNEEMRLFDFVNSYLKAFDALKKHMTTPLPFPLVQLTKTALFVWLYSLPFCLCHDNYKQPAVPVFMVFLITFGFLGLEFCAMELSDCFGDDPSDFDDMGHAQLCFEDIYVSIYRVDGADWAQRLRNRLVPQPTLLNTRATEDSSIPVAASSVFGRVWSYLRS